MAHYSDPSPTDSPVESLSSEPRSNLPNNKFSAIADNFILRVSRFCSWLWVATLLVVLINVFSRFFLHAGSIALEELAWHLFGAGMILTLAYGVVTDEHVRVDVLFERFSPRSQGWIELVLMLLLVFPILLIVSFDLFEYAYRSWEQDERSPAASGLPHRFILKFVIPVGVVVLIIALVSRLSRVCTFLLSWPRQLMDPPNSGRHLSAQKTEL
jgi:TRAP-type mannitol/chloroaromatic compound transport system permease small subunit